MVWAQRFCCAHISFSEKTAKKSKKHLDKSIHREYNVIRLAKANSVISLFSYIGENYDFT